MIRTLHRAALALVLVLVGCSDEPSRDQCTKLLEHLIDLEVAAGGGKAVSDEMKADLAKQKKQIADYASGKFMDACVKQTPTKIVECATEARSLEAVAACDGT